MQGAPLHLTHEHTHDDNVSNIGFNILGELVWSGKFKSIRGYPNVKIMIKSWKKPKLIKKVKLQLHLLWELYDPCQAYLKAAICRHMSAF